MSDICPYIRKVLLQFSSQVIKHITGTLTCKWAKSWYLWASYSKAWTSAPTIRQNPEYCHLPGGSRSWTSLRKSVHQSSKASCVSGRYACPESPHRLVIVFSICTVSTACDNYYDKNKNQARNALELQIHSKCKIPIIKRKPNPLIKKKKSTLICTVIGTLSTKWHWQLSVVFQFYFLY